MDREALVGRRHWVLVALVGWVTILGLILVQVWPAWPQTWRQWGALLAVGPPVYVLGELAVTRAIDVLDRVKRPAWVRGMVLILMGVAGFLLMVLIWLAVRALSARLSP